MLTAEGYRTMVLSKKKERPSGKPKRLTYHENRILALLETYEIYWLEGDTIAPKNRQALMENLYQRIRFLHELEQLVFKWIHERQLPVAGYNKEEYTELTSHLRILDEVQKERTSVTRKLRRYGIPLTPIYRYGIKPEIMDIDPMALDTVLSATCSTSTFPLTTSASSQADHSELLGNFAQLTAYPSGAKLVSDFISVSARRYIDPAFEVIPEGLSGLTFPELAGDEDNPIIRFPAGITARKQLAEASGTKGQNVFTFIPPFLALARVLLQQMYPDTPSEVEERLKKLYAESGLPYFTKWGSTNALDGDSPVSGSSDTGSDSESSSSPTSPDLPNEHRRLLPVSRGMGASPRSQQATMSLLEPTLDFKVEDVNFATLKKFRAQGAYGRVYEFETKDGKPRIIKFVRTESDINFAFTWFPEKEALASNFINVIGRRVTAPPCLALPRNSPVLGELFAKTVECPNALTRSEFYSDLQRTQKAKFDFTCLIMEKMSGRSRKDFTDSYGTVEGPALFKAVVSTPDYQASLGELFLYDLLMGNYDRLWRTIHNGNVLFNIKPKHVGFEEFEFVPEDMPLHAIDQTISVYGQFIFLNYLETGNEKVTTDEYAEVGKFLQDPHKYPVQFHRQATKQMSYLHSILKKVLDNLIAGTTGQSLSRNFLSGIIEGTSTKALEMGMVEGMLKMKTKGPMIEAFSKMSFPRFQQDTQYLFDSCHMVRDLIDKYDEEELLLALTREKGKIRGLTQ
ncbi:hypothetical protein FUAX_41600 (plasmid) [Fulvitalea axinellae]|uniref:Uncharacterized protein n=1 Tax=Fulvitalea axinellae TaxID=1182444 RepID=A0AAU9CN77_9BACT|nr:hypothetical protein FUAX_41600 [Fulvitalea axinellae]